MNTLVLLVAFVASSYASSVSPYDQCYREGDIVLDRYNRCKYRQCKRVVPESGYGHLELEDKDCPEGTGVPFFLLQQYMHGVYAGHRFIGSHLASTVCGDKAVKRCEVSYGHPSVYHPHGGSSVVYHPHGAAHNSVYQGAHYGGHPRPYYQQRAPSSYRPTKPAQEPVAAEEEEVEATAEASQSNSSEE